MASDKEKLVAAMGEVASLPPEDPLRQQIEADIAHEGEWAEKEWMELLTQDEHFRIALRRVDAPHNLEKLLLTIPERKAYLEKKALLKRWQLVTAAVFVFGLIIAFVAYSIFKQDDESKLQSIVTLAINDHINDRHLEVATSNANEFIQKLSKHIPFEIVMPDIGKEFQLAGGRPCKLGLHPIVYSLWKSPQGEYSLFQIKLADFGLADFSDNRLVRPKTSALENCPCEVLFWCQGKYGFILVADHGELLRGISPKR